ncbi:MAG: hypothetical protein ABSA70_14595 [Terriglobia bacterium]
MSLIWTKSSAYRRVGYDTEAELESAILQVQAGLFGPNRVYLDIKRKVGAKGGLRNLPDGYIIDLSGKKPRLYVVENELAAHDPREADGGRITRRPVVMSCIRFSSRLLPRRQWGIRRAGVWVAAATAQPSAFHEQNRRQSRATLGTTQFRRVARAACPDASGSRP